MFNLFLNKLSSKSYTLSLALYFKSEKYSDKYCIKFSFYRQIPYPKVISEGVLVAFRFIE